jgi:hypothetical protein
VYRAVRVTVRARSRDRVRRAVRGGSFSLVGSTSKSLLGSYSLGRIGKISRSTAR